MLASELPGILRCSMIDVRMILSMPTLMFLWKLYPLEEKYLKDCLLDFSSPAPHLLYQFPICVGCGRKPGNMNQMLPSKTRGIYFLGVIFKLFLGKGGCFIFRFIIFRCAWPLLQVLNHPILPWIIISNDFTDYSAIPLWLLQKKKE